MDKKHYYTDEKNVQIVIAFGGEIWYNIQQKCRESR